MTRELCVRMHSKAMLTGSIAALGSQYVIALKAVACNTGTLLAQEQGQAAGKEAVMRTLDNASACLRKELGESLNSVAEPDSCALFINERGQAIGHSFTNTIVNPTTGVPTLHPFVWDRGAMTDLGTLGGTLALISAINESGQIVGISNLAGDSANHPYSLGQRSTPRPGDFGRRQRRSQRNQRCRCCGWQSRLAGLPNPRWILVEERVDDRLGNRCRRSLQ